MTSDTDWLADRFEQHRPHLRRVAYRMLGSVSEAEDAVQEAWIRLNRSHTAEIENLGGWLTTVVGRVCLNMLSTRRAQRETPFGVHVPDPIVTAEPGGEGPEQQALIADSVGLALQVVLDTLGPAERLAFVLHDIFAVPFEDIALIVDRTPAAARQLASRARRRIQGQSVTPDRDLARQREVVDAFLSAARGGDFDVLLELLAPDAVLRADAGALTSPASVHVRGARAIAEQARSFAQLASAARPALVNGAAGFVVSVGGRLVSVAGFTVSGGRIVEIDILADPVRLGRLDLSGLDA